MLAASLAAVQASNQPSAASRMFSANLAAESQRRWLMEKRRNIANGNNGNNNCSTNNPNAYQSLVQDRMQLQAQHDRRMDQINEERRRKRHEHERLQKYTSMYHNHNVNRYDNDSDDSDEDKSLFQVDYSNSILPLYIDWYMELMPNKEPVCEYIEPPPTMPTIRSVNQPSNQLNNSSATVVEKHVCFPDKCSLDLQARINYRIRKQENKSNLTCTSEAQQLIGQATEQFIQQLFLEISSRRQAILDDLERKRKLGIHDHEGLDSQGVKRRKIVLENGNQISVDLIMAWLAADGIHTSDLLSNFYQKMVVRRAHGRLKPLCALTTVAPP